MIFRSVRQGLRTRNILWLCCVRRHPGLISGGYRCGVRRLCLIVLLRRSPAVYFLLPSAPARSPAPSSFNSRTNNSGRMCHRMTRPLCTGLRCCAVLRAAQFPGLCCSGRLNVPEAWADNSCASIARHRDHDFGRFYERFGFRHHSDRQVGGYFVARYEYPLVKEA